MLNQIVLVGRINQINKDNIIIKVTRNYKNDSGEYEDDLLKISLFGGVLENTKDYCKVNDIIGVKGRLESKNNKMIVKGDKITFLTSKKENEE